MASITLISAVIDRTILPVAVGVTFSTSGVSDGQTVNFRFFAQGIGWLNNYSGTYNGGASKTVYFTLGGTNADVNNLTVDCVASTDNFSTFSNYVTATNESTPSFPSSSWDNGYVPRTKDQYVQEWNGTGYTRSNTRQAGNCVGEALTSMMETFYYKKFGVSGVRYSVSWVFGNRLSSDFQGDGGMFVDEALRQLQNDGVSLFNELSDMPYPDNMMYYNWDANGYSNTGAQNRVASKYNDIITNARKSRIASWTKYSPAQSNISTLISALQSNGVILVQLREAYNFWTFNLNSNYSVKKPDDFSIPNDNHVVIIRGWTQIGSQYYWICHNNWGFSFGNNGYFLMPVNYTAIENYWTATENIQTLSFPVPATPTTAPTLDSNMDGDGRSGDTLYVQVQQIVAADSYSVKIRRGYDNVTTYVTSQYIDAIYCGHLQYGVTYYISYAGVNSAGTGNYGPENAATTLPQPPTISGTTTQSSISITANVASPVGNFTEIQVERYDASSNYIDTKFISFDQFNAGNKTVTWSGLGATTTYKFKARTMFTVNSVNLYSNYSSVSTLTTSNRPSNFAWDTVKTSGQTFNLTATEWNSFTNRINQFLTYKGQATISFTSAPYGDGSFFAFMYNQAANAFINTLNAYSSTPYTHGTASSGGTIYAYLLNDLVAALNNIS
jgi:hypothetical protein